MRYFVYILSNTNRTLFKVGITENIAEMLRVERQEHGDVYTKTSGVTELIHSEEFLNLEEAEHRRGELRRTARDIYGRPGKNAGK